MYLLLMRHGRAMTAADSPGTPGDALSLTPEGVDEIRDVGRGLVAMGIPLAAVFSSPLKRAAETARIMAEEGRFQGDVEELDVLDGSFPPSETLRALWRAPEDGFTLLVGHTPLMGQLATLLLCGRPGEIISFRRGQIAAIECPEGFKPATGVLLWTMWAEHLALVGRGAAAPSAGPSS